ncbi:hypothetical protein [Streptomyces sp. NRRL S-1868]|uniref:hypothetical protein n=1 Tax=Streptomyces sp. NRRL S-1868 TaxID=1463892 RepID=UPI0018FE3395|nr:hypothetical protein [Streptomyces sp. NRRL S-1868]
MHDQLWDVDALSAYLGKPVSCVYDKSRQGERPQHPSRPTTPLLPYRDPQMDGKELAIVNGLDDV